MKNMTWPPQNTDLNPIELERAWQKCSTKMYLCAEEYSGDRAVTGERSHKV